MKYYINPSAIILRVSGKDSKRYLNARLSNDVKALEPGSQCSAAALSPQGRTEGLFIIKCLASDEYLLVCDGGNPEEIIPAFKRYMVADRVEVKNISTEFAHVIFFSDKALSELDSAVVVLNLKRATIPSFDLLIPKEKLDAVIAILKNKEATVLDYETFRLLSIKAGIPSFPGEINQELIFSAAGLDYAISFKKGCYVGQEVIEKIDAYGRVPYVLKAVSLEGKIDQISEIKVDGRVLSEDKIMPRFYDIAENRTYLFLELKNTENIASSKITINNQPVEFVLQK